MSKISLCGSRVSGFLHALPWLLVIWSTAAIVFGQGSGSSLSGLISDSSEAAVPSAKVTARHVSTNVTSETVSDNAGYYRFPSLPVGEYEVTVDHAGFAQAKQHIKIDTAQNARQDFVLAIAGATETVTVAAAASDLSPDDAMIGTTIDNNTVENTPLYLRNWDDLLRLVPGVQASRYTDQSGATSAGRTGDFNVHGIHSLRTISSWMASTTTRCRKTCRS